MTTRIYPSKYKNIPAIILESDELISRFLPEYGGKMASLVLKKTGREFLSQDESREYKTLQYDGNYGESECSGFDDMFPTIDRMYYTDYPWKGVEVPDHGEVCGLSWDYEIRGDCLIMGVYGVRLPYRFEKQLRFKNNNLLSINYKATNLSGFDMDFLWAAHTMINVEEGGEIILPYRDDSDITFVFSGDKSLASYNEKMKWPNTLRRDGNIQNLNITCPKDERGDNYKYYFDEKIPEGWCAYRYNSDGTQLKIEFSRETVPYLGIWVNEGSFHGLYNIALEPCTGSFDRPDAAKIRGQNSVLQAKSEYTWYFNITVEV